MNGICKICGSETREFYDEIFDTKFYHCSNCEFISKDENSIISEKDELKIYKYHNNSIEDQHFVDYFKRFLDSAVMKNVSSGKKGLDFGSGPSSVLSMILERDYGYEMDIYDMFFSPEKTYIDKKYDLITCTEVIEHLKNPMEYFLLFKELLKDDGTLGIMTLFHANSDEKFCDWHYRRDRSHISFFTAKTMKVISEKIGLELVFTDNNRYSVFR
ncbi:MAG: class I SAM-dependent methyltransferase [Bacillota bacterium]|nr:class I SAM-dependent methyltransferase [Bacillota bacterium]